MNFGLNEHEFHLLKKIIIDPLKNAGARVYIFGSRARGDNKKFSDIDILFELSDGLILPKGMLATLKEEIEESHLPYKVDLVNSSELAKSYAPGIHKEKVEIE